MSIAELAKYIRTNKRPIFAFHPHEDEGVICQYARHEMNEYFRLTDEHILECAAKATSYQEFIELCRPLARADHEEYERKRLTEKVPKGRTRRRFR